jgi:hypothetical protein
VALWSLVLVGHGRWDLWIHFLPLFHDQVDHSTTCTVGWVVDFLLALMCGGKLILLSSLDSQAVCPHSLVQEPIEGQGNNKPSPTYNMQNICWSALQSVTGLCCMELSYPQKSYPIWVSCRLVFCFKSVDWLMKKESKSASKMSSVHYYWIEASGCNWK